MSLSTCLSFLEAVVFHRDPEEACEEDIVLRALKEIIIFILI